MVLIAFHSPATWADGSGLSAKEAGDSWPVDTGKSELIGPLTGKIKTKRLPTGCGETQPDGFHK